VSAPIELQLGALLDVVSVGKLGVPSQPEMAIGALSASACNPDEELLQHLGIIPSEIESVAVAQAKENLCRGSQSPFSLSGRTSLLVDDGLPSGSTMRAAVRHVKNQNATRVVAVVPVGSQQACDIISAEADQ
jgi:putative phosphoribosyl transferase